MILCATPGAQYRAHAAEIDAAIRRVLDSGWFILGNEVKAFEKEFAAYIGVDHCIGVANGTDALALALRACHIGPGDEVITTAHTAVATVAAIEMTGAAPVMVDIDPTYYTLDPQKVAAAITPNTKAIIAVHIYGQPADLTALEHLAKQNNLRLIEDCAQAHGATFTPMAIKLSEPRPLGSDPSTHGRSVTVAAPKDLPHSPHRLGSFGDLAAFSFYPTKNLGAIGDGGAVVTNNPDLAHQLRLLREYGWAERYVSSIPGVNTRLDELQAAILRAKLPHLDADNAARQTLAAFYDEHLAPLPSSILTLPHRRPNATHVNHLYVIRSPQRDALQKFLKTKDIGALIHYPVPIHQQPAYANRLAGPKSLPHTEQAAKEVLSLPMYPELSFADAQKVVDAITAFAEQFAELVQ